MGINWEVCHPNAKLNFDSAHWVEVLSSTMGWNKFWMNIWESANIISYVQLLDHQPLKLTFIAIFEWSQIKNAPLKLIFSLNPLLWAPCSI